MATAEDRRNRTPLPGFGTSAEMIAALEPREPVYCLYPDRLRAVARRFLDGFPGRPMFAVKANPFPEVIDALYDAGVRCFDTASLPEIALVKDRHPDAEAFYMAPVRIHGTVRDAYERYGVRNYVVDHDDELGRILDETRPQDTRVFVRTTVPNEHAIYDLSTKFGASPDETVAMLDRVRAAGAEPALAFNVGSMVMDPASYQTGLELCADILERAGEGIRHLDIGGGFPWSYRDIAAPALETYFERMREARARLPLPDDATLYCEPGRAMCADGLSLVVQVLLRKDDRVYINDGVYGSFSETNISGGDVWYPTRTFRRGGDGPSAEPVPMTVFGPTCDSLDRLPKPVPLPADIRAGDWIEVGTMGAYSNAVRTAFNGFHPDTLVEITGGEPPALDGNAAG